MSEVVRKHKDRAAQLIVKGKLAAALEEYKKVVAAVPSELQSRQKVAELLARMGKKNEAIAEYEEVVKRYAASGQFFKATALCKVILQLDPAHERTQASLADLYAKRKEGPAKPAAATREIALDSDALFLPSPVQPALPSFREIDLEVAEEDVIDGEEIPIEVEPAMPAPAPSELPVIPLFSDFSREDFIAVLKGAVEARAFAAGDKIVREGEPGNAMYAIVQGRVGVVRPIEGQLRTVAQMHEGDLFGEMALVSESPRLATIVAETDTVVLEFARQSLDAIIARHPTVSDAIERFYRDRLLQNLLRSSPLLRPLSDATKRSVTSKFESKTYNPGEVILQEGLKGDGFYLLLRGRCAVFHKDSRGNEHPYPDMREGDAFGEISVLMNVPVSATVRATTKVVVLKLAADKFRDLLLSQPAVRPMLTRLATERLQRTADLVSRLETAGLDLRV